MKNLKYEGMVKLKIFRSLKRLEAGLNGFRIKRVHYGKFGLQIIREPPNFSKPNAPSPFYIKTHRTPSSFSPRTSFLLSVFFFSVSFLSGDDGRPWRRPRAGQTTVLSPSRSSLLIFVLFLRLPSSSSMFSGEALVLPASAHGGRRLGG